MVRKRPHRQKKFERKFGHAFQTASNLEEEKKITGNVYTQEGEGFYTMIFSHTNDEGREEGWLHRCYI